MAVSSFEKLYRNELVLGAPVMQDGLRDIAIPNKNKKKSLVEWGTKVDTNGLSFDASILLKDFICYITLPVVYADEYQSRPVNHYILEISILFLDLADKPPFSQDLLGYWAFLRSARRLTSLCILRI
jgi:hypothetical protein